MITNIKYFLFASLIFVFGCNQEKRSRIAAEKFLEAYSEKRFEEAKKYATSHTQKMVNIASSLHKNAPKNIPTTDYEILDCKERGNKATVKYRLKGSSTNETLFLVKRNDNWLVGLE